MHLRIAEGISWTDEGAIASGWINTMKVTSKNEFVQDMSKLKLAPRDDDVKPVELDENDYVFDSICPKMINLHDKAREKLAVSYLVREHRFVFLVIFLFVSKLTMRKKLILRLPTIQKSQV